MSIFSGFFDWLEKFIKRASWILIFVAIVGCGIFIWGVTIVVNNWPNPWWVLLGIIIACFGGSIAFNGIYGYIYFKKLEEYEEEIKRAAKLAKETFNTDEAVGDTPATGEGTESSDSQ